MPAHYLGLICTRCNAGYPLASKPDDPSRFVLQLGPYELACVRCEGTERHDRLVDMNFDEPYSLEEMAASRECITLVTRRPLQQQASS